MENKTNQLPTTHYPLRTNSKIAVFGATGLVGSAIVKKLIEKGYTNIIGTYHNRKPNSTLNSQPSALSTQHFITYIKINLLDSIAVQEFFEQHKPEYVFLSAAKVGGIVANNTYRADFIYENLQIQNNVIYNAYKYNVKKLMFLGSTCIYPKNCPQPIKEEYLLTGELEYTNEPYAIAKIAGIKMCESFNLQYGTNFISVMPTNLYGENDNFDLEKSHVLPALIRKIHLGKCLEEENFDEIRKDLDKNPLKIALSDEQGAMSKKVVDGSSSEKEIIQALDYYGIKLNHQSSTLNPQSSTLNPQSSTLNTQHSTLNTVSIEIWGTGKPMREFLYSDDMADACVFLMEKVDIKDLVSSTQYVASSKEKNNLPTTHYPLHTTHYTLHTKSNPLRTTHFLNIGTGKDISIKDLANLIKDIVGYNGDFYFNTEKPDGTMRKVTDVSKLNSLGWSHSVELKDGIAKIYKWYTSM